MKFLDYQVQTEDGDAIRVDLSGSEANVRVMDEGNFQSYRSGVGGDEKGCQFGG